MIFGGRGGTMRYVALVVVTVMAELFVLGVVR